MNKFARLYKFSFLLIFTFLLSNNLFSRNIYIPSDKEAFIITGISGEVFSGEEIIQCGLLFSLCEQNSPAWNSALDKYYEILDYCISQNIMNYDEVSRAERINEMMYEACLSHYKADQTKIDVMLNTGRYNCVSSSLLYLALAMDFDIDARVQETAHHAFVSVYLKDGRKIDVETTNPFGFDPGTKKLLEENANGSQKYAVIPKTHYSNRNEISQRRAIVLIGKNICSTLNEKNDFSTAVPLAAACYTFVNKEKALTRSDFDTLTTNFAIYADKFKESETGLNFLDAIIDRYGTSNFISTRYDSIAFNSSANSCNAKDYKTARKNFEKHKKNISAKTINEIQKMITEGEIFYTANQLQKDEGINYIHSIRNNKDIEKDKTFLANLDKIEETYWSQKIQELGNQEKYYEASLVCEQALVYLPKSSYLKSTKTSCLQNHGITVHNRLVPLMNSKKYAEALEILEEELIKNPDNNLLKKDLKLLQQAM